MGILKGVSYDRNVVQFYGVSLLPDWSAAICMEYMAGACGTRFSTPGKATHIRIRAAARILSSLAASDCTCMAALCDRRSCVGWQRPHTKECSIQRIQRWVRPAQAGTCAQRCQRMPVFPGTKRSVTRHCSSSPKTPQTSETTTRLLQRFATLSASAPSHRQTPPLSCLLRLTLCEGFGDQSACRRRQASTLSARRRL